MEKQIILRILNLLGANRVSLGYNYIIYGMEIILQDNKKSLASMKSLYVDIAKYYNTSLNCVEKNIRHIIKTIWIPDNNKTITSIFGKTSEDKKPTNKEFFLYLYDYLSKYNQEHYQATDLSCVIQCPVSHQYCKAFAEYCMKYGMGQNEW